MAEGMTATAHAEFTEPRFRIYGGTIARKWWQWTAREEWYIISSEGATLGPFASYVEAADALYSAGVKISR